MEVDNTNSASDKLIAKKLIAVFTDLIPLDIRLIDAKFGIRSQSMSQSKSRALRFYDNYTKEELIALADQVQTTPSNKNTTGGLFLYTPPHSKS